MLRKREQAPTCGSNEEEKNIADIAYRKIIIRSANVIKIKAVGKYLFETYCKQETKVRG
jgi:hypothetical protein